MIVLGISAFYHDSAAALVEDGESSPPRRKNASPARSTTLFPAQRDRLLPRRRRDRARRPRSCRLLRQAVPEIRAAAGDLSRFRAAWLSLVSDGDAAVAEGEAISKELAAAGTESDRIRASTGTDNLLFSEHHLSHAAAAFFPRRSRRPSCSRWTASANGRPPRLASGAATTSKSIKEIHFPHSLGLLYSAFTYYTGFKVNSGEYKVMGLAPYGEPKYTQADPRQSDRPEGRRIVPAQS